MHFSQMINFESNKFTSSDELLKQLLAQFQNSKKLSSERQLITARVVDLVLRSRPISRSFHGKLSGIYYEIYELVKQEIFINITKERLLPNLETHNINLWKNNLQKQAFRSVLNDEILKKLALETKQTSPESELRSYALNELIKAIQLSGRLCRPYQNTFKSEFYQLLYEEAVVVTLSYVALHIELYDPTRGKGKFMNWVNFRLDKAIIECRRRFDSWQERQLPTLKDLENFETTENTPLLSELLYQCIEEDNTLVFEERHIRDRPDANFRAIALARFNGYSWEEIAEKFQLSIPTLSCFYRRSCQEFADLLRQDLEN